MKLLILIGQDAHCPLPSTVTDLNLLFTVGWTVFIQYVHFGWTVFIQYVHLAALYSRHNHWVNFLFIALHLKHIMWVLIRIILQSDSNVWQQGAFSCKNDENHPEGLPHFSPRLYRCRHIWVLSSTKVFSNMHKRCRFRSSCACAKYHPGPSCSKPLWVNELVKGHFVNCFSGLNIQYSDIFCWKNVSSFCTAKATHIFSAKNFSIFAYHSM